MITGNDEASPCSPRDLDGPVRALDAFDAAQKHQWSIRRDRGRKLQGVHFGEVWDAPPVTAAASAAGRDVVAAAREGERARCRELHREADRAQRWISLIGHDDRDGTAKKR